jgi:hypothetical protein
VRKLVAFLTVCLAASVGVLAGGTQVALAASCPSTSPYASGYSRANTTPAVGQSVSAGIDLVSSHLYGGSLRGYIQVITGTASNPDRFTAGIRNTGSGPQIYFEHNGTFLGTWNVSYGTFYGLSISHDSSNPNIYIAHWDGGGVSQVLTMAPGAVDTVFSTMSNNTAGTTCNDLDFYFRNLVSPFDVNHMQEFVSNPYLVHTFSASEFEVHEP